MTTIAMTTRPLTVREHMVLELEGSWWKYPGAKETAVREQTGYGLVRYYQVLNALLDRPEAEAAHPLVVRRLRRMRVARAEQRSARRLDLVD